MRRVVAAAIVVFGIVGAVQVHGLPRWGLGAVLLALGLIGWRLSVCPHHGPLALLPSTTDLDGAKLPARWFCDACGKTWAANLEKPQTPIQKFKGYDESKATQSAKRARELVESTRILAARRAGVRPSHTTKTADAATEGAKSNIRNFHKAANS